MKNHSGYFIIAGAIVIASIIISSIIYIKNTSSLDHCYNKAYKHEVEKYKKDWNYSKTEREHRAAVKARIQCKG